MLLCKVEFNDSGYKTLGELRRVNFDDKDLFIEYLIQRLGHITESYGGAHSISKITFTYIIKDGEVSDKDRLLLKNINKYYC